MREREGPDEFFLTGKERIIKEALAEFEPKTPPALQPHLQGYLETLVWILDNDPVTAPLAGPYRNSLGELAEIQGRIAALKEAEQTLVGLTHRRTRLARAKEPATQKLWPATGRLARAVMEVVLPIKFARPDLAALDTQIKTLAGQARLNGLEQKEDEIGKRRLELRETILGRVDTLMAEDYHNVLVHLLFYPHRLRSITSAYAERVSKKPSLTEAFWYTVWAFGDKIAPIFEKSAPGLAAFRDPDWSFLTPLPLAPELIEQIGTNLQKNLPHRRLAKELAAFALFGLRVTAERNNLIPLSSGPQRPPIPSWIPEDYAPTIKPAGKIIFAPQVPGPAQAEVRQTPVIHLSPGGRQTDVVLTSLQEITPEKVGEIFGLKEGDPKVAVYCQALGHFWQNVQKGLRWGDMERIKSPKVRKRTEAEWKTRFGDLVITFNIEGGNIIITAIGSHQKIYGETWHE